MKISYDGLNFLIREEGSKTKAYRCQAGVLTIGVGHTGKVNGQKIYEGMKISQDQVRELLRADISVREQAVNKYVNVELSQAQFDALISLVFNIGVNAFKNSTLLKKINARYSDDEIAEEWKKWRLSKGKVLPVLVVRREREVRLFTKGIYK